jgi:CheY-like chemotaxis protein
MPLARLLLVDDEPAALESLGEYLKYKGYELLQAESLAQAVDLACKEKPDAVVSDLMLPGGTGLSLYSKMKLCSTDKKWNPCFVIITGNASLTSALEAIRLGVDDYLLKPIKLEDLNLALKEGLARHRLSRQPTAQVSALAAEGFYQELTAPFHLLRAYLDMFLEQRFGPLTELQAGKMKLIEHSAAQMLSVLRGFHTRLLSPGTRSVARSSVDVTALLHKVQREFYLDFERRGVSVFNERPKELPRMLADVQKAGEILENLLGVCLALARPGMTLSLFFSNDKEGTLSLNIDLKPAPELAETELAPWVPVSEPLLREAGLMFYAHSAVGPWSLVFLTRA